MHPQNNTKHGNNLFMALNNAIGLKIVCMMKSSNVKIQIDRGAFRHERRFRRHNVLSCDHGVG